jgi:hypothetical protein
MQPWVLVDNLSQPTMTVYSPKGTNIGVAVVVFPGGGYWALARFLTSVCIRLYMPLTKKALAPILQSLFIRDTLWRTPNLIGCPGLNDSR